MSITPLDLKFRKSQRMTDFDDGGGRMSNNEVVDGVTNNVFSDLSDGDAILGDVSLRKIFLQVDTANTDTFLKPLIFLTDLPQNENVSICLFGLNDPESERSDARNYYENYRNRGVISQYILYGDHFIGQKTMQVYCRSEIPSPDIGDVFALSIEKVGFDPAIQYVQVREVALRTTNTFTDDAGDFVRDVLILKITSALTTEFPGIDPPRRLSGTTAATLVRNTQISDSALYFGMKACATAPQTGDLVVLVDSPYIPAVPSSQSEVPVVDQLAGSGALSFVKSGATGALTYSATVSAAANIEATRYFGTPYCKGSLAITVGSVALRDDGEGSVVAVNGTDTGWSGSADYESGLLSVARDVGFSGTLTASATPAGVISTQAFSKAIPVTAANRDITYVFQIDGQPSPGTVTVDFAALGKWITLRDNGRGQITGRTGQGGGTVNYATGSVAVTLGALPDVDTALIVAWGVDVRVRDSSGEITIPAITFHQQLAHPGAVPASLTVTWKSGGVTKTGTAAASGAITGDMTGAIDVSLSAVEFTTALSLDPGEQFHYAYTYIDPSKMHSEVFTPTAAGHAVSLTLAHVPVQANSVVATWTDTAPDGSLVVGPRQVKYTVHDNGTTGWVGGITGTNTINLTTGAVVLTVDA